VAKGHEGAGSRGGAAPFPEMFWNFSLEMMHFMLIFKVQIPIVTAWSDIFEGKALYSRVGTVEVRH